MLIPIQFCYMYVDLYCPYGSVLVHMNPYWSCEWAPWARALGPGDPDLGTQGRWSQPGRSHLRWRGLLATPLCLIRELAAANIAMTVCIPPLNRKLAAGSLQCIMMIHHDAPWWFMMMIHDDESWWFIMMNPDGSPRWLMIIRHDQSLRFMKMHQDDLSRWITRSHRDDSSWRLMMIHHDASWWFIMTSHDELRSSIITILIHHDEWPQCIMTIPPMLHYESLWCIMIWKSHRKMGLGSLQFHLECGWVPTWFSWWFFIFPGGSAPPDPPLVGLEASEIHGYIPSYTSRIACKNRLCITKTILQIQQE